MRSILNISGNEMMSTLKYLIFSPNYNHQSRTEEKQSRRKCLFNRQKLYAWTFLNLLYTIGQNMEYVPKVTLPLSDKMLLSQEINRSFKNN